jgi:hypothetical protein
LEPHVFQPTLDGIDHGKDIELPVWQNGWDILGELRQWQTDAIDHRLTRNVLMLMVAGAKSLVQAPEQVIGGRQYFHPFAQKLTCHGIPKIAYFTHVKTAAVSVVEDFLHSWYFLKQ